jgi:hypothetical protein
MKTFYNSFELLVKDYLEICSFIDPDDRNLSAFSHRTYECFFRSATEFENVSKFLLAKHGSRKAPKDMNISDYSTLDGTYQWSAYSVGLKHWIGGTKFITPFFDWRTPGASLQWYQAYNHVKHDRTANFNEASFENLTLALAGLFLVLFREFGHGFFNPYRAMSTGGSIGGEVIVDGSIFSVKQ